MTESRRAVTEANRTSLAVVHVMKATRAGWHGAAPQPRGCGAA